MHMNNLRSDLRLSPWLAVDVDSVAGCSHRVDLHGVGNLPNVTPILWVEICRLHICFDHGDRGSTCLRNVEALSTSIWYEYSKS
jgi:hypothetical protein